jgi:hypothetical protein
MLRIAPSRMQRRKILRDTRGRQRSQDRRSNVFHAMSSPFQPWAYLIFRWPPTRPVKAGNPAQGCQLGEGQRGCLTFLLRTMRYPIGLPDGAHHRRRRLPGTQDRSRRRPHRLLAASDRPPLRPLPLRRPPEALDRRTHPSLDQPKSPARQRLRAPRPKSRSLRPPRHDPPHAATPLDKPLIRNQNFPERLLEDRTYEYAPGSAPCAQLTGTFALTSIGRFAILSDEVTTHVSPADRFAGSKCAVAAIITHIAVAQTALPQVPDMNGPQRDIEIKLG